MNRRGRWLRELPLFIWLVVLWVILWRDVSLTTFLAGVLVAAAVLAVFSLPPVDLPGRFHLGWAFIYVGVFFWQLIAASAQVSIFGLTVGRRTPSAVVAVPLRSGTDVMLAATAQVTSLIPGSVIIKIDRASPRVFVHALGVANDRDACRLRESIRATEAWLIRVMGSRAERDQLAREVP